MIGPELGLTLPGMTIVCGDSHTSTHGASGRWPSGSARARSSTSWPPRRSGRALRPHSLGVEVTGQLEPGLEPKDIILAIIRKIGTGGATGHVIEYYGPAITALSMEGRMTICNMSIEGGARAGLIAPDDVTIEYIARGDRPFAPRGRASRPRSGLARASDRRPLGVRSPRCDRCLRAWFLRSPGAPTRR